MFLIFFSALTVAFSGAMMPGPLLTYTIRQALHRGPRVGPIIIAGHALLELLLIILILLGFDLVLQSNLAQGVIGVSGGILLAAMGGSMIIAALRNKARIDLDLEGAERGNIILTSALISAANPYFFLWWAVIGLGFLLQAYKMYALAGVIIFFVGHILADLLWYSAVAFAVGKSRRFIGIRPYRAIIASLGLVLIVFGFNFLFQGGQLLLT